MTEQELQAYMNERHKTEVERTLEQAIQFFFPHIPNLEVKALDDGMMSINFEEGKYTKEEVETFLDNLKTMFPIK